jgi:hypothetical protein
VRSRRKDPIARDPDIAAAIPSMIAATPDPTRMRRWAIVFYYGRWRPDANINLSMGVPRPKAEAKSAVTMNFLMLVSHAVRRLLLA